MKKGIVWIVSAAVLVAVLAGAGVLYSRLSARITPDTPPVSEVRDRGETTASEMADDTYAEEDYTAADNQKQIETPSVSEPRDSEKTTAPAAPDKAYAADFVVMNEQDQEEMLSDHFGKPIVVNFWATWCGFCVQELPAFNAAAEKYGDQVDFMMVDLTDGISETVENARAFIEKRGFTFPVYYDTEESAATAYSVSGIPHTLFIASDGTLYDSRIGAMSESTLEQCIESLLE